MTTEEKPAKEATIHKPSPLVGFFVFIVASKVLVVLSFIVLALICLIMGNLFGNLF